MDAYLQNPWHSDNAAILQQWLTPVFASSQLRAWLIGDGSFSNIPLTPGAMAWQPVFKVEPMSQYQEMGLFIASIEPNDLGILKLVNQLELFSGLPMFSIIVSDRTEAQISQMLTWVADARSDDGLDLYIRLGDTRCLPHILQSLSPVQKDYISYIVDQWYWPGRDGLWNQGFNMRAARTGLTAELIPQQHNLIKAKQFDALMNSGETDLIYSLIDSMDQDIYPTDFTQHKKFLILSRLIHEAKQNGEKDITAIRDQVLDRLIQIGR